MSRAGHLSEFDEFLCLFEVTAPNNRLVLALAYAAQFEQVGALSDFLGILPPEFKLPIAESRFDELKGEGIVFKITQSLPEEFRLAFIVHSERRAKIEDGFELAALLGLLPEASRLGFMVHDSTFAKIESAQQLCEVLNNLPEESRLSVVEREECAPKITDGIELCWIIERLANPSRLSVARRYIAKIDDSLSLTRLVQSLNIADQEDFANSSISQIQFQDDELGLILDLFPEYRRLAFFDRENWRAHIDNGFTLASVITRLPMESQLGFALRYSIKINNILELVKVLESLPMASRLIFAETEICRVIIKNSNDLRFVLSSLPEDSRVSFAESCIDKIGSDYFFLIILNILPKASREAFAQREDCRARITHVEVLFEVLLHLRESSRMAYAVSCRACITDPIRQLHQQGNAGFFNSFVGGCLRAVQNGSELAHVLAWLHEVSRNEVAERHELKIQNGTELVDIIKLLPVHARMIFALRGLVKIHDAEELYSLILCFPRGSRSALVESSLAKIQTVDQLVRVLRRLPDESQLSIAERCRDHIKTRRELEIIFSLNALKFLSLEEKISFLDGCNPTLRMTFLPKLKIYSRTSFDHPIIREMINHEALDPNAFLFDAAANPSREVDFEYFLMHPLCAVNSINERSKTLVMHIEEQGFLSPEIKAKRIAKVRAQLELKRQIAAAQPIAINLSSVRQSRLKFEGVLPSVEPIIWEGSELEPEAVKHFRQLIRYLTMNTYLVPYQESFVALENNILIRVNKQLFKNILDDLESLVATLELYFSRRKLAINESEIVTQARALASCLDACDQLGLCVEGVRSALHSMIRSLNPGARIANALSIALDQAIKVFVGLCGISDRMEVHASRDRLLNMLGVDSEVHYDPFRLPISEVYLQAIVRNALGRLTPDFLVSQSLPSLESMQEAPLMVFNARNSNLLERDWQLLYTAGLVTENRTSVQDKYKDILLFIDSTLNEDEADAIVNNYLEGNLKQNVLVNLTPETLKTRYWQALRRSHVLTRTSKEIALIQAGIWSLLTINVDLRPYDAFLKILLNAPNGLAWIKGAIEAHSPRDWVHIRLNALLHCPAGSSNNLFRALAADPYYAGWMMGWELKRNGGLLSFNSVRTQPLLSALTELGGNTRLMHKEMEEIFVRSGNLLFWLGELQKDAPRRSTFSCIMGFISAKGMYCLDSLLGVLAKMISEGDSFERKMALSFLEARCAEQKTQKLWDCYWKTRCHIEHAELSLDSREILLSLMNPVNARAALYVLKSNQTLALKLTQAIGEQLISVDEFGAIMHKIRSLYPESSVPLEVGVSVVGVARETAAVTALVKA